MFARLIPSVAQLLRHTCLVAVLVAPIAAGCSTPAEEDAEADESALSGRVFQEGMTVRVTANRLNMRSSGSASSRVVTTLSRDDIVTVVATSGGNGWVNIRTEDEKTGWASSNYLTEADDSDGDTTTADGATCAPSRATDVVNRYQKAFHDTIAWAEGTRDQGGKDGYNIMFRGGTFASCQRHPNRCIRMNGGNCSTAAGRYQFLKRTWTSIANTRGYATFEPENQERGAAYLIASVRRVTIPTDRPLTESEFEIVMTKLSYEWASLPPARYPGQGTKPLDQLRAQYCTSAGC
jgi:muramidase (phage lysozyme)